MLIKVLYLIDVMNGPDDQGICVNLEKSVEEDSTLVPRYGDQMRFCNDYTPVVAVVWTKFEIDHMDSPHDVVVYLEHIHWREGKPGDFSHDIEVCVERGWKIGTPRDTSDIEGEHSHG